jgi:gamma-glutamylcyclotransferase (GGCT)/AIG2-like uncharacterized protein YtfP
MPRLFSYGSLQQSEVQVATFGRTLSGRRDALTGFEIASAQRAGKQLATVVRSPRGDARVAGTVFEISAGELAAADEYERADDYVRISVTLASGADAWMYVDGKRP